MMLRDGLVVGARHHLFIGGCDAVELAREYGTPLFVLDELYLRGMCKAFVSASDSITMEAAPIEAIASGLPVILRPASANADLIISGVNEVLRQVETETEEKMDAISGGLNIPGLF